MKRLLCVSLFILVLAAVGWSEEVASTPLPPVGCDGYNVQEMPILSTRQKTCWYADHLLTWTGIFGATTSAWMNQVRETPGQWRRGPGGWGKRFGTAYTQSVAKSTAEFLTTFATHEDIRPTPPDNPACGHSHTTKPASFGKRLGRSLLASVWLHGENCGDKVAWSHVTGAFASGFIGMAWLPARDNTVSAAFTRTGTAMGGYVSNSVFREFQPDIIRLTGRMFGRGKAQP